MLQKKKRLKNSTVWLPIDAGYQKFIHHGCGGPVFQLRLMIDIPIAQALRLEADRFHTVREISRTVFRKVSKYQCVKCKKKFSTKKGNIEKLPQQREDLSIKDIINEENKILIISPRFETL